MDANELATFLREEVPHLWEYHSVKGELKLTGDAAKEWTDALDAAVGLLREAHDALNLVHPQTPDGCVIDNTIATLRLVVGEVESHHSIPGG